MEKTWQPKDSRLLQIKKDSTSTHPWKHLVMPAVNKIQGSRFLSFQTSIVCPTLNNLISTAEIKTLCFIFVSSDIFTSVNSINGDLQRSTEQMEPQLRQSKQMKMARGPQRLYTSRASRCAFHRHSGNPDCILPSLINMRSGMTYEVGGTGSYLFSKWRIVSDGIVARPTVLTTVPPCSL